MTDRPDMWSREHAERYLRHVVEREERLLAELATWMRATGGPLEAMDASVESLVDYWRWFVDFADQGTPGVPAHATPSMYEPSPDERLPDWYPRVRPIQYAAQAGEHYLRLVIDRLAPPAEWVLYVDKKLGDMDISHHSPAIMSRRGKGPRSKAAIPVWHLMLSLSSTICAEPDQQGFRLHNFPRDIEDARRPERLRGAFALWWNEPVPVQDRSESVLTSLPDTPTVGPFPSRNEILGVT